MTSTPATAEAATPALVYLRAAGVSVLLDGRGGGLPVLVHWGADLGALSSADQQALADVTGLPPRATGLDVPVPVAVLPEASAGWFGTPGVVGSRSGRDWSTRFGVTNTAVSADEPAGGSVIYDAVDADAGLAVRLELVLTPSGLLRVRARLTNTGADGYELGGLSVALPVPSEATEIGDFTGRWARERVPQRHAFTHGSHVKESRRGRPGFDSQVLYAAGTSNFGFRHGEVWALHLGWSGNQRLYAERLPSGFGVVGGGELLLAGEVVLASGESYDSPWLYAAYGGHGLDEATARMHEFVRARPSHPARPRPVVLNTWEAVYFDHDLTKLKALADAAVQVGAERYVLDDGWFRHRRDDHAGLGDWYVDEDVWPDGLTPLIDYVRSLGLEFGLWFEPEMVNPDSDLARAHPDWLLRLPHRLAPQARHQQVLDLGNADAYAYLLERIDTLLTEYDIAYVKWDHNRELVDAGHLPDGRPGVHAQTLALYRLLDELRVRHPGVEIESCSSGGARVDLGILERTDRVWGSDCIDALERQAINRWTSSLIPYELIGSHIGTPTSHTTGRTQQLSFRAGTAIFGHLGIEWDLTRATDAEKQALAWWVQLYKDRRALLHSGRLVRTDHPDPDVWVHGVVAADRADALFSVVAMRAPVTATPGRVRLPGLEPDRHYRVRALQPPDEAGRQPRGAPTPLEASLTGASLASVGVSVPGLQPESLLLLEVSAA
jgi:alpha-galactosidase